jgi:FtsZ-binding cell division protein ZapB
VTSRATEIQTLIADIDNLLANKGKRLARVLSIPGQEPRLVLERVRTFLVDSQSLEGQDQANAKSESPPQVDISQLLVPLQLELQALLDERKSLVEEIRQLEQQRSHNFSLAQQMANQERMIAEFLQVLASRMDGITPPMPGIITNNSLFSTPELLPPDAISSSQVERLSKLAGELDHGLLALDGTVNTVFAALQHNIQTKSESLTQALNRMHGEGLQGEELLKKFIDNLNSQLQLVLNKLPSKPVADGKEQKQSPADDIRASELPEIDFNLPEGNATPDLDALLLELNQNTFISPSLPATSNPNPPQAPSKIIPPVQKPLQTKPFNGDEVDLLYASLFNTEDGSTTQSSTYPVSLEPISVNQDLSTTPTNTSPISAPVQAIAESEITTTNLDLPISTTIDIDTADVATTTTELPAISTIESSLDAPTSTFNLSTSTVNDSLVGTTNNEIPKLESHQQIQEQIQEQVTSVPDPWLHDADAGLLDLHQEGDNFGSDFTDSSINWETFIVKDDTQGNSKQPIDSDTIAVLTDLVVAHSSDSKLTPSNNLTASSQELLLEQATAQIDVSMPDIALDDSQLQQLDRDLANFDSEQDSVFPAASQYSRGFENTPSTTNIVTNIGEASAAALLAENGKNLEVSNQDLNLIAAIPAIPGDIIIQAPNPPTDAWYLGIDLGTSGISSALLNLKNSVVYPLYWSADSEDTEPIKRSFRLPAEVYLPVAAGTPTSESQPNDDVAQNLFSAELKPYLQIAIPYRSPRQKAKESTEVNTQESTQKWEPVLQLNEVATVPLVWMVRSLSKLLLTLKSDRNSTTLGLTAAAIGLDREQFRNIIDNIAGVICSTPSNWSEQYRFNIREALLISKLVPHPQQVFFIEEAIASLLSELDGANGEFVKLNNRAGQIRAKSSDTNLVGNTLVINIGAGATEMTLVDLPENLLGLAHSDFMLHSFAYAGKGIEQDIVSQLLLPPKWRKSRHDGETESIASNPWHWQPSISGLDRTRLSSLKWEELTLPRAGEPDIAERIRFQQRLESSRLGQALLDAAAAIKLILQHQESFSLELADQRWLIQRRDLESQIFVPFVRRLNRELNRLLVARGIPTEAINQAILTGGVASLGAVSRWLRQKLPNARIIQDLYLGENGTPTCSRVAYGLSMLPLHPQVLEIPRQQYTDYFLFTELLRLLPERALSFGEVIQLFEERGINTRSCQQRLLAFLEGELPAGLVPNSIDSVWLTSSSVENSDYKANALEPLFAKQGSLTYRPNTQQIQSLRRYLDAIKASTQQSLEEPYTVNFAFVEGSRE